MEATPALETRQHTATSRRVQKWKKLARYRPSKIVSSCYSCHVGEKRPISSDNYDKCMVDAEVQGKAKKCIVPMDVDASSSSLDTQVAGPTQWALGSQ